MIKIIVSIIVCLFLSFAATFAISKSSKENWIMKLEYEHIERNPNINYIMLDTLLDVQFEKRFINFVSKLVADISTKYNNNPCSEVRGIEDSPKLIAKFMDLKFEVTMAGNNKELMLKCEEYIDKEVNNFQTLNLIVAQKLFNYEISKFETDINSKKDKEILSKKKQARELIVNNLVDFINTKKKEQDSIKKNLPDYLLEIDNLTSNLVLLSYLEETKDENRIAKVIDFDLMDLKIVKKIFSDLSKKNENQLMLFISIFIILQTIIILIFFKKTFILKTSHRKKINKIISKLTA